ncbi:MAG TPA: 5'-3' exonuclease [Propionibacteriaceae bacterium]|nr:5'-3' exonuclease [Propionibacteriaceae bacterium]
MSFDTASLYFRAFFGVPMRRTADGTPVNAVRGLIDSLARLIDQYHPTHLACAWDNDWRPGWRVDLVASYKAHRVATPEAPRGQSGIVGAGGVGASSGVAEVAPDDLQVQIPIIIEVLAALGLWVVGVDGYEADDVLASLASQSGIANLVVTGDRDLFQLAHGDTRVVYVGRGVAKHDLVDAAWVAGKYGVLPEQYVDFATLRGDPSDGLPGVKGIGEKSAASLVATYGDLEEILAAAGEPASGMSGSLRSRLAVDLDYLARAREVVRCVDDLDLGTFTSAQGSVDADACAELAERYELGTSMGRILAALASIDWPQTRPST